MKARSGRISGGTGLLDSAFWHKFSLTLHSTVLREWKDGLHPDLHPVLADKNQFAENALSFEGESRYETYSDSLNSALECWMRGEKLKKKVETYFPFRMPSPSVPADFVDCLIARYEKKRDDAFSAEPSHGDRFVWVGGDPIVISEKQRVRICWTYMGELLSAGIDGGAEDARKKAEFLRTISADNFSARTEQFCAENIYSALGKKLFFFLRGKGLCALL